MNDFPNLSLINCDVPIHNKNESIIAIFVPRFSAYYIEWVEIKTPDFFFLLFEIFLINFHIYLLAFGSIPVEG